MSENKTQNTEKETSVMLEVKNLCIQFGGLKAVDNFNLTINKGQLYGLIGPNGAGKTTVFNMLTGVYKPTSGSIIVDEYHRQAPCTDKQERHCQNLPEYPPF